MIAMVKARVVEKVPKYSYHCRILSFKTTFYCLAIDLIIQRLSLLGVRFESEVSSI